MRRPDAVSKLTPSVGCILVKISTGILTNDVPEVLCIVFIDTLLVLYNVLARNDLRVDPSRLT